MPPETERVISKLNQRHRSELTDNGMTVLRVSDLQVFERDNLSLSKQSYPQGRAHLTVYSRRAVLNVAMLLRDSTIARRVRTYLLDAEERARGAAGGFDAESACSALDRIDRRPDGMDSRLAATDRVVCALGERVLTARHA